MFVFRVAKLATAKAAKPSLYAALLGAVVWLGVDLADGASDRFHTRLEQGKTAVVEPSEAAAEKIGVMATKLWHSIEGNPGPSVLALVLFLATVIYHKRKGTSTIEALKAAVLKHPPYEPTNPVLEKIQREALEGQMLEAFDRLEKRDKDLPFEIGNANLNLTQKEQILKRTAEIYEKAKREYDEAVIRRQKLIEERELGKVTMKELEAELAKA